MANIFGNIVLGLQQVASPSILLAVALGVLVGLVFGSVPGLTATMGVAVLSPLTLTLEPLIAIPFLIGVYRGGLYGGVVTSVTVGVPGTPSNVPTLLDGYPLARKGYPQVAMHTALCGSVVGAVIAALLLFTLVEPVASFALDVGQPEIFALLLFSISLVSFLSGRRLSKGWLSASLGLAVALVGIDPIVGLPRFTFGISALSGGIAIIPMVIGLFAISELAIQLEGHVSKRQAQKGADGSESEGGAARRPDDRTSLAVVVRRYWQTIVSSSAIGSFIGLLPGIGSETSPWLSYSLAKRISKRKDNFGRGEPEGVVAAEVSNDAVVGSAFIPLLIFGIPGDLPLAVMLGVFLAQGLRPGPNLFDTHPETIYGIVATVLISSVFLYLIGRPLSKIFSRIVVLPSWLLFPSIGVLCLAGAYATNNTVFDVSVMALFGVVGYLMRKMGVPLAPMVLAYVLGPRLELAFRRSLLLDPSPTTFLSSPMSVALLIATAALFIAAVRPRKKQRQSSEFQPRSEID